MKISDLLIMCVQNLSRRKFRTFLTVIGVVIGTTAIVSMISLGLGISKTYDDMISNWGDLSIISVYGWDRENPLDDKKLSEIGQMEGVAAVSPFMQVYIFDTGKIVSGKKDRYETDVWSIYGVYADALDDFGYSFSEGGTITSTGGKRIQLIFGSEVAYQFRDSKRRTNNTVSPYPDKFGIVQDPFVTPLTDNFKLQFGYYPPNSNYGKDDLKTLDYDAVVTGVLTPNDINDHEARYNIYIDIKDLQKIISAYNKAKKTPPSQKQNTGYDYVKVKVSDVSMVGDIQDAIKSMGYEANSLEADRQEAMKSTRQLQIILGGLGAVSLLVASISIANTMVMSVYERTKEIGVMKVLGCFVNDIRKIFLIEAAMIGFFGGVIGIAFSYLVSFAINTYGATSEGGMSFMGGMGGMGMMGSEGAALSYIPLWLVLLGMAFAVSIGVIAGVYPAYRAVKISALEAIKQD